MANPEPKFDAAAPRVSFVSLGCPKALVDSERIVTRLRAEGYELAREHKGSDLVIVNTCGFLDSAKAESLAAIGNALRENGKVIVTGCMGAEPDSISSAYPDVLAITGPQQYETVVEAVHKALPPKHDPFLDLVPPEGIKLTPRHYAYLKISEGCNNRCTFCIIPRLRGDLVSRPAADVLREAEKLVKTGVKELLVISQDTSAYGLDIKYAASKWRDREVRAKFIDLAAALGELGVWVRLHYVYPYPHVDEVIPLMAERKVLPYLDIPFQHVPFKGTSETTGALLGGHVDAAADATGWASLVNAGQLRLLVLWTAVRSKNWPDAPTLREVGIDLVSNSPFGIAGPKGMDPAVVKIIHDAFRKGAEDPAYLEATAKLDQEPAYLNSEDYRRYAAGQLVEQKKLIEDLGLKQE